MVMGTSLIIWWWVVNFLNMICIIYFTMFEDPQVDIKESFYVGHIFTSVAYTLNDVRNFGFLYTYDSDAIQWILNYSANAYILAILADIIPGTLKRVLTNPDTCAFTIGSYNQCPHSIGDIQVSWLDSLGTVVQYILKYALYFPDSLVNIISITAFADQLEDDEGTWIMTKRHRSIFTWDFGKHSIDLTHPTTRLPAIRVNQGFAGFKSFYTFLSRAGVVPSRQNVVFTL